MALIATFSIFTILLIIMFPLILNIVTSVWAYRDAIRRGNSKEYALIVLVATLVFPIVGLLVYLIIRKG
ncbi:MAG TPA: hypothetical protein GX525_09655 [Bacilli bacterium]|nr:hypothetical protein [Bacilli bacterium]